MRKDYNDEEAIRSKVTERRVGKEYQHLASEDTGSLGLTKPIAAYSSSMAKYLDPQESKKHIGSDADIFQFITGKVYENRNLLGKAVVSASAALPLAGGTMTGAIAMGDQNITGGGTVTGTIVKGTTSLQTPLIEFTDGDDAITIADGGVVTIPTLYSNNFDVLMAGSFKATSTLDDNYAMPGNMGIDNATWGFQFSNGASGLGNSSQHIGVMVPYKCQLVGVVGNIRSTSTGDCRFALWTATLTDGANASSQTWTKSIETDAINITAGSKVFKYSKVDGTVALDAFDTIVPTIKNETGTTNTIYGNYTILIRRVA
jgi:hypothetical protein